MTITSPQGAAYEPKNVVEKLIFAVSGWVWAAALAALLAAAGVWATRGAGPQTYLRAKRDLAPFTAVHLNDFQEVEMNTPPPDAVEKSAFADGRVTTIAVKREEVLTSPALLDPTPPAPGIGDWQVYNARAVSAPPTAGETVSLFGVGEDSAVAPELLAEGAVVFGTKGEDVVVAVPADKAVRVRAFLLPKRGIWAVRAVDTRPTPPK